MATKTFDDGSSITFDDEGRVRAVECVGDAESVFSEHKSLKQMSLDLMHFQLMKEHGPKPKPKEEAAPAKKK